MEGAVGGGLEEVVLEEFVVAEGGGVGEEGDEVPGLGGGPGVGGGEVEDVHFEDFGGGLGDYFADGFCERCGLARM